MKMYLWEGMLAAAIALPALSGVARAQDNSGCSDATLTGEYAFGGTAYTPPFHPNGPPLVFEGIHTFDGMGNLTQRDYRGGTSPAEFSPPGSQFGTYAVNRDCTGSLDITELVPGMTSGEIKALIVISNGGRHIHEVVSELIVPGSLSPAVPVNTSADDWKVGSN